MRPPRRTSADRLPPRALGSIRGDELLPSREFCRRLGLGAKAWRELVHKGLPTIRAGKQAFIDGAAAIAWFRRLADGEGKQ